MSDVELWTMVVRLIAELDPVPDGVVGRVQHRIAGELAYEEERWAA